MANFFLDNEDIQFLFDHMDLAELAASRKTISRDRQRLPIMRRRRRGRGGQLPPHPGDRGRHRRQHDCPAAEQVDHEGNTLNEDGTVTLHPLVHAEPQSRWSRPT